MYKGNRERVPVPRIVEDENVDNEYDNLENDYDEVGSDVDDINEYVEAPAGVGAETALTIPKHISQDFIKNRQSMNIHVYFVGTPQQFAMGHASTVYRLSPANSKYFQQNIASKNRMEAGDEMRFGDSRAIVPVAFHIIGKQNTASFKCGFRCNKLENSSVTKDGAYLMAIPGKTKAQTCNINVFKPNSIVEKQNYLLGKLCTMEDIGEHIIVKEGSKNGRSAGIGFVETGTFAYKTLIACHRAGMWRDQPLTQEQINSMYAFDQKSPDAKPHAEVTPKMAADLKAYLSKEIQDVLDRCVNINDITFTLERADGQSEFNSPQGLIGSVVGNSFLGAPSLKDNGNGVLSQAPRELSTVCSIGFDATMEFFPL